MHNGTFQESSIANDGWLHVSKSMECIQNLNIEKSHAKKFRTLCLLHHHNIISSTDTFLLAVAT